MQTSRGAIILMNDPTGMIKRLVPVIGLCLFAFTTIKGQELSQRLVSVDVQGASILDVMEQLQEEYSLRFAYSRRFIPLDHRLTVSVSNIPLNKALDIVFSDVPISYILVSDQIVLRPDKAKLEALSQRTPPEEVQQQTPLYQDKRMEEMLAERRKKWEEDLPDLQKRYIASLNGVERFETININDYRVQPGQHTVRPNPFHPERSALEEEDGSSFVSVDDTSSYIPPVPEESNASSRLAQVSILPFVGTNTLYSYQTTNQVSVNVLWGMNGGVKGMEVGGLANTIKRDVQGIQIAGLFNTVGGKVVGSQFSGLANVVRDSMQGLQASGLFNLSGETNAVQASGLFNVSTRNFAGVQASGLFNVVADRANAVQASGLFNFAGGDTKTQIAGLFNIAKDVEWGQAAGLLNVARDVKGFQIGLINVADTVSGVPIGLINVVKNGYNRVELSGSEFLYGNFALKVGVKRFYNIFYIGARIENVSQLQGERLQEMSWGLGYGIGTAITFNSRLLLNLEAVSVHVNERDNWTDELHQLNQFKILLDGRIGKRTSLFAGPVGNLMISKLTDPESGQIGTQLAPYTFHDQTKNGRNTKIWVGLNAGIRF